MFRKIADIISGIDFFYGTTFRTETARIYAEWQADPSSQRAYTGYGKEKVAYPDTMTLAQFRKARREEIAMASQGR